MCRFRVERGTIPSLGKVVVVPAPSCLIVERLSRWWIRGGNFGKDKYCEEAILDKVGLLLAEQMAKRPQAEVHGAMSITRYVGKHSCPMRASAVCSAWASGVS